MKLLRNRLFAHITQTAISKTEFKTLWKTISDILIRRGSGQCKNVIDKLLVDPFTLEEKDYVVKLKDWYYHELDVKKAIQNVATDYQELKIAVPKLHNELSNLKTLVNSQDLNVKTTIQSLEHAVSTLDMKKEIQKLQSSTTEIGDKMSKMTDHLNCYNLNVATEYQELKIAVTKLHNELSDLKTLVNHQDLDIKTTIQSLEHAVSTLNANFVKFADSITALEQEKNAEPPCERSKTGKTSSNH